MKKAIYVILLALVSGSTYWFGVSVSRQETYLNVKAVDALDILHQLQYESDYGPDRRDELERELNEKIILFGYYIEERVPIGFDFAGVNESSLQIFKEVIEYRLVNPRIKEGVKYSPFREGWESTIEGAANLERPKIESRRYKLALQYYSERKT